MEIFVNKVGSTSDFFRSFIDELALTFSYATSKSSTVPNNLIIDNSSKQYWYEETFRADRQPSHYMLIDSQKDSDKVIRMVNNEEFARFNSGKPDWSLMEEDAFEVMIRVLEAGAKKYSADNWKKGRPSKEKMLDTWNSTFRHLKEIKKGIKSGDPKDIYDLDLGINHIGNLMCNAMFMGYHMITNGDQEIFNPNK